MMRWLKDKKKEKRTNSSGQEDDGKEDDYGFEKEKTASKSPSTRRELPPTPAAPEEKSPHIYEEIPDLSLISSADGERVILQSKSPKSRAAGKNSGGKVSSSVHSSGKQRVDNNDDISPYMVVPVDREVRQTPTNFHRNGTPEVHCDVIVKDTHWEILLTRKPKVGAFRMDSGALSSTGESSNGKHGVRNNTHYCSRDRRASVDVHSAGKLSSAFSMTSSALSSSSTSRVNSMMGASSMSLSNFSEHQPMQTCEENESGGSRASSKGVVTYTTASNFIGRATKLTFNPLPGKDPRKEAFGSDSSDGSQCAGYPCTRDESNGFDANGVSYSSIQNANSAMKGVSYASIQNQQASYTGTSSGSVNYASIQDQVCTDTKLKHNSSYGHQASSIPNPSLRTGIIRPASPSNSSTCTYASVHFPVEPKHYSTIPDLIPLRSSENDTGQNGGDVSDSSDVFYSQIDTNFSANSNNYQGNDDLCDNHTTSNMLYPRKRSFRSRGIHGDTSRTVSNYGFQNQERNDSFSIQGTGGFQNLPNSHSVAELSQNQSTYNSIDNMTNNNPSFTPAGGHCGNNFQLEFCSCSDEHSSSCGCLESKPMQEDDTTSVAGTANEGPTSCKGCGRLIRQITYSESYSDETYDHAYSSRLLIRTGRRFSSPDITFSEISNSEFQDVPNSRSPEFMQAMSRDDTWATYRSDDIIPPAYGACDDNGFVSSRGDLTHWKGGVSDTICAYNADSRFSSGHFSNTRLLLRQNTSPASSDTSSVTGIRAATSTNSILLKKNCSSNVRPGFQPRSPHPDTGSPLAPLHPLCPVKSFTDAHPEPARKRSAVAMLEPKSNAFSGLFSKFSKAKSSKSSKRVENESKEPLLQVILNDQDRQIAACDKDLEEIPDRNTKKLSKFFSRLSSKEVAKDSVENLNLSNSEALLDKETACGKTSISAFKPVANETSGLVSQQALFEDDKNQIILNHQIGISEDVHHQQSRQANEKRDPKFESQAQCALVQSLDTLQTTVPNVTGSGNGDQNTGKTPNKTDSGDTCYEYDVSTSSEGEQTSYDCFLSSVKKTLNLDHEVQHIADSSHARKKLLCKRCKREELYSTIDDGEDAACGGDNFCPHLSAKFGDLRAIFDDLVVDQRAAILDCLTDYAHSPYNIKCQGHESHCRECGCEIMTSDSESLTTVYSLLSQQFRMTSPSAHTPSCDSDEGTMADNSGESGDEAGEENKSNRNNNDDSDKSSGYDEPECSKLDRATQKHRKRDKRDKRSPTASYSSYTLKGHEKSKAKIPHGGGSLKYKCEGFGNGSKTRTSNIESLTSKQGSDSRKDSANAGLRKNVLKKSNSSYGPATSKDVMESQSHVVGGMQDDDLARTKMCSVSKSRMTMISDKALQDIYAPLPSKALSLLTSRNHGVPSGMPCTCGRVHHASLATVVAHPATIESKATKDTKDTVKSLPSHPVDFGEEETEGVISVQTHLEREVQKNVDGGLCPPTVRKDCDDGNNEGWDMVVHLENEITTADSTMIKKSESHDGHSSPTKQVTNSPTKEGAPASVKEGSIQRPNSSVKHNYHSGNPSACRMGETRPFTNCESTIISTPHTNTEKTTSNLYKELPRTLSDKRVNESDEQLSSFLTSEENAKSKYSRKQRLKLATLDLLPETALDGDSVENEPEQKSVAVRAKRSKVVEKMAKVFEVSAENSSISNKKGEMDLANSEGKNKCKLRPHKANNSDSASSGNNKGPSSVQSSDRISQPCVNEKLKLDTGEFLTNNSLVPKVKETPPDLTQRSRLVSQDNLCGDPESRNLNLNETPSASDSMNLLATSKTRSSAGRSKHDQENETKTKKSNNDMGSSAVKRNESKCGKGRSAATKLSTATTTTSVECRHSKQKSPTPSSSSSSSSSSTKRKTGLLKHKKLSKKSYNRKRSKSRTERNRSNPGKEERTYYYFSSDLSDIDVVEVEDWETYATKLTPTSKSSHSKKSDHHRRKRSTETGSVKPVSSELKVNSAKASQRSAREAEDDQCEQEIYAIPPSSSELRGRRAQGKVEEASPEISKPRKTQRTDVYKTRKSDNKLLSDLIIRNYDMQIYGNV